MAYYIIGDMWRGTLNIGSLTIYDDIDVAIANAKKFHSPRVYKIDSFGGLNKLVYSLKDKKKK